MTDPLLTLVPPREPRPRRAGPLLGLLVVATLAAGVAGILDDSSAVGLLDVVGAAAADEGGLRAPVPADPVDAATVPAVEAVPAPAVAGPTRLGDAGGLELALPGADPVVVSYHEASFPEALAIAPAGAVAGNANPTRSFEQGHEVGPDYLVQVSRGRRQGPTTAVDVVLRDGDEVLSPVAGTVVEVRPYLLYGVHEDVRIELVPDDHPALRVVLIHVHGVAVAEGDRVAVGDVLAAGARVFPFEAVVDRATAPDRFGHVHLEVKEPTEDGG